MNFKRVLDLLLSKLHWITIVVTLCLIVFFIFDIKDTTSYWQSVAFFLVGSLLTLHSLSSQSINSVLDNLKGVIVGSLNIGLKSIKRLEDNPPKEIAKNTHSSFKFIGIAGGKFLKETFNSNEFFINNNDPKNIQIMLMDPMSKDIRRLSRKDKECNEHRAKILESLDYLNTLRLRGYNFEVRLYPKTPPLRLMISDGNVTTLSVYAAESTGWKNAQLIFDTVLTPDSLAPHFKSLFEDLWERGININLGVRSEAIKCLQLNESTQKYDLGMVHGRFQPFHHEHLEYVLWGISHSKKCLIAITQPEIKSLSNSVGAKHRSEPEGNPYSFEQRKLMVQGSLNELGIASDRFKIIPFDVDNISESLEKLKKNEGALPVQFVKIFSDWENHKKTEFKCNGCKVIEISDGESLYSTKNITGTLVRELINSKRNWEDFVPNGTMLVVKAHNELNKNSVKN